MSITIPAPWNLRYNNSCSNTCYIYRLTWCQVQPVEMPAGAWAVYGL